MKLQMLRADKLILSSEPSRGGETVFINIVNFPPIKKGKDEEFTEWFEWSNSIIRKSDGFISRQLLKPTEEGNYAAIVVYESEKTFMTMHQSRERQEVWAKAGPLFDGNPTPHFYEVVITSKR